MNSQRNAADTAVTSGAGDALEPECKLRSDVKLNSRVFWERFAQAGFRSTGSGQLEWRIQWPLMHPELDPGSVMELLMTLGAEIIVVLL